MSLTKHNIYFFTFFNFLTFFFNFSFKKVDSSSLENAFDAPNMSPLGSVGIGITVKWNLVRHVPNERLRLRSGFDNQVSILRIYPGQFTTLAQSIAPPLKGA